MENYSLQLIWSDEKHGYIATVPEIPHLQRVSETAPLALVEIHAAIATYLREKNANREPAPAPRHLETFSGQFRLRLPRALHAALVTEAENEGVSLNTYILYLLGHRHSQQLSFKQAAAYGEEIRETMQAVVQELVSSATITSSLVPSFSWRNDSSVTITQMQ
jgi:hypothetical protein